MFINYSNVNKRQRNSDSIYSDNRLFENRRHEENKEKEEWQDYKEAIEKRFQYQLSSSIGYHHWTL